MKVIIFMGVFYFLCIFLTSCNVIYSCGLKIIEPNKNKIVEQQDTLDYDNIESWYSHPDKKNDPVDGDFLDIKDNQVTAKAAVFYIHPTSYISPKSWNKKIDVTKKDKLVDEIIIPNQATVFIESFAVYAPKYPQATFAAFTSKNIKATEALTLATDHIEVAFKEFLKQIKGKPFALAGHSQGSYHVVALLQRLVIGTELEKRLITAIAPGYPFPIGYLESKGIKLCKDEQEFGCLETWTVLMYDKEFLSVLNNGPLPESDKRLDLKEIFAVTNPMQIGKIISSSDENLGSYLGGFKPKDTPFVNEMIGAEIDFESGVIRVSKPSHKKFGKSMFRSGWYHQYEYAFYFKNILNRMNRKCNYYFENHMN